MSKSLYRKYRAKLIWGAKEEQQKRSARPEGLKMTSKNMLLEVCANSYQSAKNAQDAGAHRIELCQELTVGGITPSYGLLKQVTERLQIPVFVLIRPRAGNFVYSVDEFEIMKTNIRVCKDLGCQGIVSGVLRPDKTIDLVRTKELVELSKPLSFTFHRAFDEVANAEDALKHLIDLGVDRLLTSGQESTAAKGLDVLKLLHENSNGKIIILAGAGISAQNASKFKAIGLTEIHASASLRLRSVQATRIDKPDALFSTELTYSDPQKIKAILDAI